MPTRPREHQLEDISVRFFEGLLPPQWVCRRKQSDYGVDLEVEVFEEDGQSTSLTFIVQIKATDDAKKRQSVAISLDRLRYLACHDAPSMIARYCEPTKTLHFEWVSNITADVGGRETKSITLRFVSSNAWEQNTPQLIHKTLRVYRRLKSVSETAPIGLTLKTDEVGSEDRFALNSIVSQICNLSKVVKLASDVDACIPVTLNKQPDALRTEIDVLASVTDHLDEIDPVDVMPRILYALAFLMGRFDFRSQFWDLVRVINQRSFTTQSRLIAGAVSAFASSQPEMSADLARRNELHNVVDEHYWVYLSALLQSKLPVARRNPAIEQLTHDAIVAHQELPEIEQATFHYNLANHYMGAGEYRLAVRQFNLCRKKSSVYLSRPYFLREFASCLFFERRYTKAAELYLVSFHMDRNSKTGICTGDALLYSGHFDASTNTYQRAVELAAAEGNLFAQSEAALKVWLSEWVAEFYSLNDWIGIAQLSDRHTWMSVIDECLSQNKFADALAAALMEGFIANSDDGLWADAVAFAFNTQDEQIIGATLSCAVWRGGYEVYEKFRSLMKKNGFASSIVELLDEQVESLVSLREKQITEGYTLRFVDPEQRETLQEVHMSDK